MKKRKRVQCGFPSTMDPRGNVVQQGSQDPRQPTARGSRRLELPNRISSLYSGVFVVYEIEGSNFGVVTGRGSTRGGDVPYLVATSVCGSSTWSRARGWVRLSTFRALGVWVSSLHVSVNR